VVIVAAETRFPAAASETRPVFDSLVTFIEPSGWRPGGSGNQRSAKNLHRCGGAERSGLLVGQTLARHIDNRLTLSIFTHAAMADQTAAAGALPGPPVAKN
jgi:hypothetical protein